jgi:surfeit locus 1 family protein
MSRPRFPVASNTQARTGQSRLTITIFALFGFGTLIALGVWQLERRSWKNRVIASLEAGLSHAPSDYRPNAGEFSHVRIKGEFLNADTLKLLTPAPEAARGKTKEGFGYQLFTPLKFSGGIVFVNRGFVPLSLANTPAPAGGADITGIVRFAGAPSWFTPPAEPDKHVFFVADIPAMAAAAGFKNGEAVTSEYIQAEPASPATQWPQPRDPRELLASIPNRHLEYIFTWFGLAAALAGIYTAYMLRS